MSITWPVCLFLQHIGYQIKAEIPYHGDKVMNIMFSVIVLDLELVFAGEAKLFLSEFTIISTKYTLEIYTA